MNINDLHKKAVSGDSKAEGELFKALSERFQVVLRHKIKDELDIEDIMQDSLAVVASKYKGIEFEVSFSAWAYKILEYNILSYYRSGSSRRKKETEMTIDTADNRTIDADPILKMKLIECFDKLCRVNSRYASVISMHFEGYEADEIAKKLKVTVNNIYVLLSRARAMLKNCLDNGELS